MAEPRTRRVAFRAAAPAYFGGTLLSVAEAMGRIVILTRQTIYWLKSARAPHRDRTDRGDGRRVDPRHDARPRFLPAWCWRCRPGSSFRKVFNEPIYVGTVVGLSLTKELGPVLTAVVVAGRVGAAIAAELGTMKVTEQIDALYTLGTNPVKYLSVPRFIACLFSMPILTLMAIFTGIIGGLIIAVYRLGIPMTVYMNEIKEIGWKECAHGIIKSFFFAAIIVVDLLLQGVYLRGRGRRRRQSHHERRRDFHGAHSGAGLLFVRDLGVVWNRMIQFEDVYKAFGHNRVLRGCTLDVRDGETLTIIGGSGPAKA